MLMDVNVEDDLDDLDREFIEVHFSWELYSNTQDLTGQRIQRAISYL
jgi:hypothetical protein